MLADDFYPNRMEAARHKAIDLLRLAPETRMALMPFAGTAVLRCPLTGDHHALEVMLQDCSPELFPAKDGYQGTAIGESVQMAVQILDRQVERGQAVLVISDGADDDMDAVQKAAAKAKELGVAVYGLFLGDKDREVQLEIDGKTELMKADSRSLDDLANASGGISVSATNDDADVKLLHEHIQSHVAQTPWEERQRTVQSERYQWPLLLAIALIAAGALLPTRRRATRIAELTAEAA
jgi:Ca-activated chloride channel family protein